MGLPGARPTLSQETVSGPALVPAPDLLASLLPGFGSGQERVSCRPFKELHEKESYLCKIGAFVYTVCAFLLGKVYQVSSSQDAGPVRTRWRPAGRQLPVMAGRLN